MSTSTNIPSQQVAPAALEARPHGLFSAMTWPPVTDTYWQQGGTSWEPYECGHAQVAAMVCATPDEAEDAGWPLTPKEGVSYADATPFLVYGSYSCAAVGRSLEEARTRAENDLYAGEEASVEFVIANGGFGGMSLSELAVDVTPTSGTPVSVRYGLGLLESAIGKDYHSVGVIHSPLVAAPLVGKYASRVGQQIGRAHV